MSQPVAIVTGAASGIGLALTRHLLSKHHLVVMADTNVLEGERLSHELGSSTLFHRTDVSSYEDQKALFSKAFKWGGGRLDFLAANAGIDDRQSIYQENARMPLGEDGLPVALNVKTIDVDLVAVMQAIWLFKFFVRQNSGVKGGKVVITSSAAGLYSMTTNPQYCAAKAALIGLTRSIGPVFRKEGITVNCICPAFVVTNLCPPHVLRLFPKEHITPMSTALMAFDKFLEDDGLSGQVVELSLDHLYFRKQVEYPNESQRWLGEDSAQFWEEAYQDTPERKNGS